MYPANPKARLISQEKYADIQLPKDALAHHILYAVDTTGDDQPEGLMLIYHCKCPEIPQGSEEHCAATADKPAQCDCDYTCGRTLLKDGADWKEVYSFQPM